MGNLVSVTEPNPSGGANFVTTYTYNAANQLLQVAMPRPYNGGTYTQTRTFTWSGTDLASETTPEAGTVQYQYDGAHHVTLRTDAAGQQTQYSYDAYGRLTQVSHWTWVSPTVIATCRNR
ncbi:MAG TPA: RHS repeat domain-containing protein [Bryobacteraceae bacterium]|nr:RHS repeat domain-containing protein [Bryobacteraceae bacterium]